MAVLDAETIDRINILMLPWKSCGIAFGAVVFVRVGWSMGMWFGTGEGGRSGGAAEKETSSYLEGCYAVGGRGSTTTTTTTTTAGYHGTHAGSRLVRLSLWGWVGVWKCGSEWGS